MASEKAAGRQPRKRQRVGSVDFVAAPRGAMVTIRVADLIELRAVLAAVKTALRRLRRWSAASLGRLWARRSGSVGRDIR